MILWIDGGIEVIFISNYSSNNRYAEFSIPWLCIDKKMQKLPFLLVAENFLGNDVWQIIIIVE